MCATRNHGTNPDGAGHAPCPAPHARAGKPQGRGARTPRHVHGRSQTPARRRPEGQRLPHAFSLTRLHPLCRPAICPPALRPAFPAWDASSARRLPQLRDHFYIRFPRRWRVLCPLTAKQRRQAVSRRPCASQTPLGMFRSRWRPRCPAAALEWGSRQAVVTATRRVLDGRHIPRPLKRSPARTIALEALLP